jgi:hypothetical protein
MSPTFAQTAQPPPSARQQRKITKLARLVERWLATIPEPDPRDYYSASEITAGVGKSSRELAPALRALGWHNVQVRLPEFNGKPGAVWIRPGGRSPKRGIGRPATANHPPAVTESHHARDT